MLAILCRCHHNIFGLVFAAAAGFIMFYLSLFSSCDSHCHGGGAVDRVLVGVFVAVTVFKVAFLHVVSKSKRTTY